MEYSPAQIIENRPAEFTGLGIVGEFVEGSTLTAEYYRVTDANGWSAVADVSWYYADDLTTIVGTGSSYVLSASDVGNKCILKFPLLIMMGLQSQLNIQERSMCKRHHL